MGRLWGLPKKYSEPYAPAEDTFFLDDHIKNERGTAALDVGSGSGYLTRVLAGSFSLAVGTDINYMAIRGQTYRTQNVICCNGADALNIQFDLVICNMPYLATDEILDVATDGGKGGLQVPIRIIESVIPRIKKGGKFLFVTSSLSDHTGLVDAVKSRGLDARIVSRKKLFFEELILIEARK